MTIKIGPVGYAAGWGFPDGMDAAFGWDGIDDQSGSFDVMAISQPDGLGDIANLSMSLARLNTFLFWCRV
jgi:hypothetical protein